MDISFLEEIVLQSIKERDQKGKKTYISEVKKVTCHTNTILHVELNDGRRIVIKQSSFDWAYPRFYSAWQASRLLRNHNSVLAPSHIYIPPEKVQKPTLVYWYMPHPTLEDVWPDLSLEQRRSAIKSLGTLLRKMHATPLEGYGLLQDDYMFCSLSSFLRDDLQERLNPPMYAHWTAGLTVLDTLSEMATRTFETDRNAKLVHNDMHLGNVLCEVEPKEVTCLGFLDLEEAKGGRWESDIASALILHHPLFEDDENRLEWLQGFGDLLQEGYGREPDPEVLHFFKMYHLLNLGLFSALNGEDNHAGLILQEIEKIKDKEISANCFLIASNM